MYQLHIYNVSVHDLPKAPMWLYFRECLGIKGVTNHLIAAARYSNKIATKDQIVERAKEVIADAQGGMTTSASSMNLSTMETPKDKTRAVECDHRQNL